MVRFRWIATDSLSFFSEEYLLVLIIRDNIAVLPDSSDAHTSAQIIQA